MNLDKEHARLSASKSHQWMSCPGSLRMEEMYGVPDETNQYAELGTAAHALGERCLREGVEAAKWLNETITTPAGHTFAIDDAMADGVQQYVDHCRVLMEGAAWYGIEEKFSLAPLSTGQEMFGTSDFTCVKGNTLFVVDYKNGRGRVEVDWNTQLLSYGLGALFALAPKHDIDTVVCTVVQPNSPHPKGAIREFLLTADALRSWALNVLRPAAMATADPSAPTHAGTWCKYCRASASCGTNNNSIKTVLRSSYDRDPVAPEVLTPIEKGIALQFAPKIESWLKALHASAQADLLNGLSIPGQKLVQGKTQRKWGDNKDAAEAILKREVGQAAYKTELVSAPQALALLKKAGADKNRLAKFEAEYVVKPEGAIGMAPDTDTRAAEVPLTLAQKAAQAFG